MKQYKSIFNEVTIPQDLVTKTMMELDGNILEYLEVEIAPLLTNGIYSKNYYKVVKAMHQMNVVQGINAKICLLFIKHFFNHILNPNNQGVMVPSTFIAGIAWEVARDKDTSFIFYKTVESDAHQAMVSLDEDIGEDARDIGGGLPFDPEYASMDDYEEHFADVITDYMEPIYVGIVPTIKGFDLAYIGRTGSEQYPNVNLKRFLYTGTVAAYNFFNAKVLLTTYNKLISSKQAILVNWLKK